MNPARWTSIFLLASTLLACQSYPPHDPEHEINNMWAGADLSGKSMRQAIIAQKTLYPYQFVEGSAELNPLGQRDLEVLADHLREHPAPLRVMRGQASEELYAGRLATVLAALQDRGVETPRVPLSDEPDGEPRTWSETALQRTRPKAAPGSSNEAGSTDAMGSESGIDTGSLMNQRDRR